MHDNFASPGHILLLEPNAALRTAIMTILAAERYQVETVASLADALSTAVSDGHANNGHTMALVAWQSMEGLLAEEHRHELFEVCRRVRVVVMVPRRWERLLDATDLSSAVTLIAKPFEADELLQKIELTLAHAVEARSATERVA